MMKILLLAPQPFFQERGTPIAVRLMAETLRDTGHEVHLFVYHEGEDIQIPHVPVHRIISLPGLRGIRPGLSFKKLICDILMLYKCLQLVSRYKFQLIHAVEESSFLALIVKCLYGIPFVYDMDSCLSLQIVDKLPWLKPFKGIMEGFERIVIRNSSGTVAVCKSLEDFARKLAPDKLITTVEDISLLEKNNIGNESLRETCNIEGPIIMYVGNLEAYQGIDLLMDSFALVRKREAEANLLIIGGNPNDIQRYKQRAKQLRIEDDICFCGPRPVSLLWFYVNQADILVSPRIKGNNTPMKVYSFLDSGKPLLATRLRTHTQVLGEQIAYLVDPTPKDMADGLIKLLGDEGLRDRLTKNALRRVKDEYSLSAFQRKISRFYEELNRSLSTG